MAHSNQQQQQQTSSIHSFNYSFPSASSIIPTHSPLPPSRALFGPLSDATEAESPVASQQQFQQNSSPHSSHYEEEYNPHQTSYAKEYRVYDSVVPPESSWQTAAMSRVSHAVSHQQKHFSAQPAEDEYSYSNLGQHVMESGHSGMGQEEVENVDEEESPFFFDRDDVQQSQQRTQLYPTPRAQPYPPQHLPQSAPPFTHLGRTVYKSPVYAQHAPAASVARWDGSFENEHNRQQETNYDGQYSSSPEFPSQSLEFTPPQLTRAPPPPSRDYFTPYPAPGLPVRGGAHIGARDGWGTAPGGGEQHTPYSSLRNAEYHPSYPARGLSGAQFPAFLDSTSHIARQPINFQPPQAVLIQPRQPQLSRPPPSTVSITPSPTSSKRKADGQPKPRQYSNVFHPSPQAMLAPHLKVLVGPDQIFPRKAGDNSPHIGTNAPALPNDEEFVQMFTKRSRGRKPPGAPELDLSEDPNADPSEEQIKYVGVTKTGKPKKIFLCKVPECGRVFKRSEHLKRHVRSIHTNQKPFQCQWPACHKFFSRHDNLNQHLRVHRRAHDTDESFSAKLQQYFGKSLRQQQLNLDDGEYATAAHFPPQEAASPLGSEYDEHDIFNTQPPSISSANLPF